LVACCCRVVNSLPRQVAARPRKVPN
jgi:hypothetical protein